jgi:RNA polymerase sigma-70 factor (ECF subfamily)
MVSWRENGARDEWSGPAGTLMGHERDVGASSMNPPFDAMPVGAAPGEMPVRDASTRHVPRDGGGYPHTPAARPTFDQVFEEHAPYVWRVLRRLGVRHDDVKDVCQEVFIVVHGKLSTYDGRCSISTWLWGLCRRKASEYRRAPHVAREDLVVAPPERGEPPSQESEMDHRTKLRLLDAALAGLDEDKRAVFVLHGIEEVPMKEVAEACGCPLQTAYSRYHAAQRQVEASLLRLSRSSR